MNNTMHSSVIQPLKRALEVDAICNKNVMGVAVRD